MKTSAPRALGGILLVLLSGFSLGAQERLATAPGPSVPVVKGVLQFFPVDDVFRPLVADPKERQFFMSYLGYRSPQRRFTAWSVGFGESLGFVRWNKGAFRSQVGLLAGVFSLFNWSSPSTDLINTDFAFGLADTMRWHGLGARLQFYHQSSHLGDEFLLNTPIRRINFSYQALEGVLTVENRFARVYAGAEEVLVRDPPDLKRRTLHAGAEYRGGPSPAFFHPLVAVDLKWKEEQNWYRAVSAKAGVEMGKAAARGRTLRLLAEYFHGYSPFGQFFNQKIQYWGGGLSLGF